LFSFEGSINHLPIQHHDVLSHYFTGHYVVEQDVLQGFEVLGLEQFLDGSFRQFGEGFISRSEYGEGSFTLEGFN